MSDSIQLADCLPPCLLPSVEAAQRVNNSTVTLTDLLAGNVGADVLETAFSQQGSGALLIRLDPEQAAFYNLFYRCQWWVGTHRSPAGGIVSPPLEAAFVKLDWPLMRLLACCGLATVQARAGSPSRHSLKHFDPRSLLPNAEDILHRSLGRPVFANRQEFHPSVEWLLQQEAAGQLKADPDPELAVVAFSGPSGQPAVIGRKQADETRLLSLYRHWCDASPEEKEGHGNQLNGDIYYSAYRGRIHLDQGQTVTVLFGPGELRDAEGNPPPGPDGATAIGGTLMVAPPSGGGLTPLPARLPDGSPYVVVFFEEPSHRPGVPPLHPSGPWRGSPHGVQRVCSRSHSRGQVVLHLTIQERHLNAAVDEDV
jgi:hypothetical protein